MFVIAMTPVVHEKEATVSAIHKANNDFCADSMDEFKETWETLKFARDMQRGCIIAYGAEADMISLFEAMCTDEDWSVGVWTV